MSEGKSCNRKIVHDIKGRLSNLFTLAQIIDSPTFDHTKYWELVRSVAKNANASLDDIVELLDSIE